MKPDRYTYRIAWSAEDKQYVGQCAEFPSLSWLDKSQEDALKGIRQLVSDVIQDLIAMGQAVPKPYATGKGDCHANSIP